MVESVNLCSTIGGPCERGRDWFVTWRSVARTNTVMASGGEILR
ncbi:hypothetical protein A2U01_0056549, partial [Trifolium medium]|nr:hypothetical protein [Trifolium medium]